MELSQAIARRRMIRRYLPDRPVARADLDRLLAGAVRAPSAGFSQGWRFLVLDDADSIEQYWTVTTATGASTGSPDPWLAGMRTAPALIVVFSDRAAYERRYAQPDKQRTHPTAPGDLDERWPVPYWHLDAAMAAMLILLGAVDAELGACWFGVPSARVPALRDRFAVPAGLVPVGTVSLGYPDPTYRARPSPARRPIPEVVSYGRFSR